MSDKIMTHSLGWAWERWSGRSVTEEEREFWRLLRRPIGGRYRTERWVFGQCFRAVDDSDGSLVILKILPKLMDSENTLAHEFEVCSRLSHKNVISYRDLIVDPGFHILVADYFDAGEYQNVSRPCGDRSLSRDPVGLSIFHQLQEGLDHVHDGGLVHAGLTRDSVLVDTSGGVKVINLMHSCDLESGRGARPCIDHQRLIYGSPEHLSGHLTPESDYFAVGTLMFEYLARRHPFWRVGLPNAFDRIRREGVDRFLLVPGLYNVDRDIMRALFSPNHSDRRKGWGMLRTLESRS
jgi:serine/threonine protein kinase